MLTVFHTLCNMVQKRRCVVFLALWFTCASASDTVQTENTLTGCTLNNQSCETHRLSTKLGSSVLLPCNFTQRAQNIVSWIQSPTITVVNITSTGRVTFSDPRFGKIHTFPNEGSLGNYSISINNVNHSDLGCYRCLNQEECVQVGLVLETRQEADVRLFPFYIYIVSGVAIVIVLSVGCYLCVNFLKEKEETEKNDNVTAHDANDDLSLPTQETARALGDGQQQDTPRPKSPEYVNQTVYENDNHIDDEPDYQNEMPQSSEMDRNEASHSGHFNFERAESQKTKQRFHTELVNRIRQASIRKHYYVNQDELHKQRDPGRTKGPKKKKTYHQYPNPIYNRTTDDVNQM